MRRREFLIGAAALAAYGQIKEAEALTGPRRALLGGATWYPAGIGVAFDFSRGLFHSSTGSDTLAMSPLGYIETGNGATDLQPYSRAFDSANWVKTGCTMGTGISDPFGGSTAEKIQEDTSNGNHWITPAAGSVAFLANTNVVASVYAKKGERDWLVMEVFTPSFASNFYASFDLTNGVVGAVVGAAGSGVYVSSAIEAVAGFPGWYRCSVIGKPDTVATQAYLSLFSATGDGTTSYQGVLNSGIYICEANLTQTAALKPHIYAPSGHATTQALTGESWTAIGTEAAAIPSIINGRLTYSSTTAANEAGYFNVNRNAGVNASRIGGTFSFVSGSTAGAAIAFVVWATNIALGGIPDSGFHFVINRTGWAASKFVSGVNTSYASGSFTLAADTLYRFDARLDTANNSAILYLPDGTSTTVTDASIGTYAGPWLTWEPTQTDASTDDRPGFIQAWAS